MACVGGVACVALVALAGLIGFAQTAAPDDLDRRINDHLTRANEAYKTGDYRRFLDGYREATRLSPENPDLLYRVARGHALVGDASAAMEILVRLGAMHLVYPIAEHPDLASLRERPAFRSVIARMERNREPQGESTVAFTFPEHDLLIEGLAYDAKTGRLFVSSVHHRKIIAIDKDGARTDFVPEGRDGLLGALGIHADASRRALWVCTTALPQVASVTSRERGSTAVFRYHLDTGALEKRYALPEIAGRHAFGDLTLAPDGDVLVSDNASGALYTIRRDGKDALETYLPAGTFRSPQGLALDTAGRTLFVADYTAGLFAVDRATKVVSRVPFPADAPAYGIDGLIYYRGRLLALQNGVTPHRVVQLMLGPSKPAVIVAQILSINDAALLEPTLGVVVDDVLSYVATSQWTNFGIPLVR